MKRLFCSIISFILIFCLTCSAFADESVVNEAEKVEEVVFEENVSFSEDQTLESEEPGESQNTAEEQQNELTENAVEEKEQEKEEIEEESVAEEPQEEQTEEIVVPEIINVSEKKVSSIKAEIEYDEVSGQFEGYKVEAFSKTSHYGYIKLDVTDLLATAMLYTERYTPELSFLTDIVNIRITNNDLWRFAGTINEKKVYLTIKKSSDIDENILEKVAGAKFIVNVSFTDDSGELLVPEQQMTVEVPYPTENLNTGFQAYLIKDQTVIAKNTTLDKSGLVCRVKNGEQLLVSQGTVVMITGRTLDLQGTISMVFYASFEGVDMNSVRMLFWDNPQNEYTEATAQRKVKHSGKDANGYRFVYENISSTDMSKKVYARLVAKDPFGNTVYSAIPHIGYSVVSYAQNMMTNTKLKPLLVKMLNYGAAAQEYFGSEMRIANEILTDAERVVDFSKLYRSQAETIKENTKNGNCQSKIVGKTLLLEGDISINYYVSSNEKVDEIGVLFWTKSKFDSAKSHVLGTQSRQVKTYWVNGDYKVFSYDNIVSKQMFDTIYARIYTRTGNVYKYSDIDRYSVKDYAANQIEKNNDPKLTKLLRCLMLYGDEAEKYFRLLGK